jgi:AcrR family transcriptional regulator
VANVKGRRRRYDSVLRQEQARQTRARILDAAQKLFSERGYANATMEAIASGAGVATDTVYATFRNKQGVLHALLDVRVTGDELPIGVLDRQGPQAVRADRSQARQVARFAEDVTGILERARPVDDVMRGAAAVDPDIAALRTRMQEGRYDNMRQLASWLTANGPLRKGMSEEDAAAIVWAVASPEVHGLLRVGRGWSSERYRDWLAATLTRTLLP